MPARDRPTEEQAPRNEACERAAEAGWRVLEGGGGAIEAAEAAVMALEDEPLLNAGTGAYLQADGVPRVDASLMSSDGRAGAVAQAPGLRHPVRLARYLLEQDAHLMLCGPEAVHLSRSTRRDRPSTCETPGSWRSRAARDRTLAGNRPGRHGAAHPPTHSISGR